VDLAADGQGRWDRVIGAVVGLEQDGTHDAVRSGGEVVRRQSRSVQVIQENSNSAPNINAVNSLLQPHCTVRFSCYIPGLLHLASKLTCVGSAHKMSAVIAASLPLTRFTD